jgi:hypothetical protein
MAFGGSFFDGSVVGGSTFGTIGWGSGGSSGPFGGTTGGTLGGMSGSAEGFGSVVILKSCLPIHCFSQASIRQDGFHPSVGFRNEKN